MSATVLVIMRRCLLVTVLLGVLLACGKKSRPIPYDATVPTAIIDLKGLVRNGSVLLRWSLPPEAPDDPMKTKVSEFRILRDEARREDWCEGCPERLLRWDTLRMDQMDVFPVEQGRVVYKDKQVSYGHVYVYRVVSVTARGYESNLSNRAVVEWDTPPSPPEGVEGIPEDRVVNLRWNRVEGAEGYRVYRRELDNAFGYAPIGAVGSNETSYRDSGLSNDEIYAYTVRSIREVGRTVVEGPGSEEITVNPRDTTPPLPPQELVVIPLDLGIELSWLGNTEADLLGYFVYRRTADGGRYRRLNESPLQASVYVDRTAVLGQVYEYGVTAVDRSPQRNESPLSKTATVRYLR